MRLRLFLSFALVALVSITVVVLVTRRSAETEVRELFFRRGVSGGENLVEQLTNFYQTGDSWVGVEQLFQPRGQAKGMGQGNQPAMVGQQFRLADEHGSLVYDSGVQDPDGVISSAELKAWIPISADDQVIGYLYAEGGMAVDREEEQDLVKRLNQAAITAAAVAGGLSMLIAIFLAYRLLRPVRELSQSVQKLGAGDLSERAPIYGSDEIAVLARNFNQMADSLQDAEQSRRAMTADIAHELRNPLAVQRANLEALQDGIYPLTPENLEPVMEQNILLSRLVDDLRTLALADAGRLQLERSSVNLAVLLDSVVDRYNPQASKNNVEIIKTWPSEHESERCVISVDSVRIEQVIGNLLSNALRYTPRGGNIQVSLVCSERKIDVDVHDSGPGIAEDSLNYVFERFYRGDTSRSREAGGTGLGLAIARQLVEAHGGELKASNHPAGGAEFKMTLPLTLDD